MRDEPRYAIFHSPCCLFAILLKQFWKTSYKCIGSSSLVAILDFTVQIKHRLKQSRNHDPFKRLNFLFFSTLCIFLFNEKKCSLVKIKSRTTCKCVAKFIRIAMGAKQKKLSSVIFFIRWGQVQKNTIPCLFIISRVE